MVVAWVRGAGVWGRGEVGGGVWEVENGGGRPGWWEGGEIEGDGGSKGGPRREKIKQRVGA